MNVPDFEKLTHFIREFSGHSVKKVINKETQFEKDLGSTGDDGVDLLDAVEKRFGVCLADSNLRSTFGLSPNEYLFHSEGWGFPPLWWFGIGKRPIIHKFTVGELHKAICQAKKNNLSDIVQCIVKSFASTRNADLGTAAGPARHWLNLRRCPASEFYLQTAGKPGP